LTPPQGILQGNGAGPAGWSAIAALLIKAMKDQGYGYSAWSLIWQRAMLVVCFAFVDDTDLINAPHNLDVNTNQRLQETQEALTLWEGLLTATGGALAPEKSYWYLVEVIWDKGKWSFAKARHQPFQMYLQQGNTLNKRLEVYEAKKALGIMMQPDGKMTDEVTLLTQKVQEWCDGVRT
jgi:hypothetical protein